MNMKLYEITGDIIKLDEMLDIGEIDDQTHKDTMELINYELINKSNNIINFINEIEAQTEILSKEIKRLQELKKIRENKIDKIKKYVTICMQTLNKTKIETSLGILSLRKSESIEIINISEIPKEYKEIIIEEKADKMAIKKALKEGLEVQGARIISNQNLQIK